MQPLAGGRDGANAQTLGAISGAAFAALAETQVCTETLLVSRDSSDISIIEL